MVVEKWVAVAVAVARARARADEESKECRKSLVFIGFMLSYGAVFILLSFLVPGISMEHQIMCWQNAMAAFAMAAYLAWTCLTVHKT